MTEWYQIISYLLTNGLRLILGLYLVAKLMDFPLERKAFLLSAFGSCLITVFQIVAVPTIGILAAEIMVLSALAWYYHREQLRLCLFLIFFYEIGVALWDFLISAGLGVLFRSERFIDPNVPEFLIGIWLVRLLMLGIALTLEISGKKPPDYAACFYHSDIGIVWRGNAFPANGFTDRRRSGWQMDHSLFDPDVRHTVLPCQQAAGNGIGDRKAKAGSGRDIGARLSGTPPHLC